MEAIGHGYVGERENPANAVALSLNEAWSDSEAHTLAKTASSEDRAGFALLWAVPNGSVCEGLRVETFGHGKDGAIAREAPSIRSTVVLNRR